MELVAFLRFLDENKMIDMDRITDDNDEGFSNRLRVQKYVYLAKYFGYGFPYDYSMHLCGPYSKQLTRDYYRLDTLPRPQPLNFPRKGEFLELLKTKSEDWLEIASTIIEKKGEIKRENLLAHIKFIKPNHTMDFIERVYGEMPDRLKN